MSMSQGVKSKISIFFLFAFILLKGAGLHSFTHKDDLQKANDCVWCHISGADNHTPILSVNNDVDLDQVTVLPEFSKPATFYTLQQDLKKPVCSIFNKPPPFYTV